MPRWIPGLVVAVVGILPSLLMLLFGVFYIRYVWPLWIAGLIGTIGLTSVAFGWNDLDSHMSLVAAGAIVVGVATAVTIISMMYLVPVVYLLAGPLVVGLTFLTRFFTHRFASHRGPE